MHVTALAALASLARYSQVAAALAVAAVCAHAWLRRPSGAPPELCRFASGRWAAPAAGVALAELGPGTRYARAWVRLELCAPGRRPAAVLLLRDQLDPESWRILQTELRRGRIAPRGEGDPDLS